MSLAIIDAREWQNLFDLETGRPLSDTHPLTDRVRGVLTRNPYPGDVDELANQWVTRTALDLIEAYNPDMVCLSYVQQFFANRHFVHAPEIQAKMNREVLDEVQKFIALSGFMPVLVGTGGMIPLKEEMNLSGLDGLAISSNWSARYCGIHWPSVSDLNLLEKWMKSGQIERIVSRQEWIDLFVTEQPDVVIHQDRNLMPEYLVVASEGYSFKTVGSTLRKPVSVPENNHRVPVYSPLGSVSDIREIRNLIRSHLGHQKIALILLEGVGRSYFPDQTRMCRNGVGWFCYEPGDAFYLTLSAGRHEPFAYPAGYRFFDTDRETIKFPFSGYMTSIPENTLAAGLPFKSIAVGNRSMFMHIVYGVDISIECFARNLFNQGCMAVIHDPEKFAQEI